MSAPHQLEVLAIPGDPGDGVVNSFTLVSMLSMLINFAVFTTVSVFAFLFFMDTLSSVGLTALKGHFFGFV